MGEQILMIGFTREEAQQFIRGIVLNCLEEASVRNKQPEGPLSIRQACQFLGVSAPTLKKLVDQGRIRRHELGGRKKVFYRSELEADTRRNAI